MVIDKAKFPHLFEEVSWNDGLNRATFELGVVPPVHLISNVYIVPFVGEECVIIRTDSGWGITGGTLEAGESYLEALQRELMEEAGARFRNFHAIGAWHCHSSAERPYRPHLPWPEYYRIVGYGDIELTGCPTNPDDGEQVLEVGTFAVEEAFRLLLQRPEDGALLMEIYQLADLLRKEAEKQVQ